MKILRAGGVRLIVAILLLFLLAGAAVLWSRTSGDKQPEDSAKRDGHSPGRQPSQDFEKLADQARKLQSEGKVQEADAKWKDIQNQINGAGDVPELTDLRREAEKNRNLLRPLQDKKRLFDHFNREAATVTDRPAEIKPSNFKRYYPEGRTIRSSAQFVITGQGTSTDWIFKGEAYFLSFDSVVLETKVLKNDGHKVKVAVTFKDVSENLIVSDEKLALARPDSPLLDVLWEPLEKNVLEPVPLYRVVKKGAEIVNVADPQLKRTLTWIYKRLRRYGVRLTDDDTVQILSMLGRLANARIELEYVDGVGVTSIRTLGGVKLPQEDLEALADSSGPMLDYFIFPGAAKKVGDVWPVRAQDVASLIRLSYRYSVSGKLDLERVADDDESNKRPLAVLKVRDGEITAHGQGSDVKEEYALTVKEGFIRYSVPDLLIVDGKIRFQSDSQIATRDHLLFGAKKLRNVDVQAVYEARKE